MILRAPASEQTAPSGGTTGTQGTSPTVQGSHQDRIDQAMAYFQSQGWSKAQAAGIVENLDAESNMEAGISQIGGGPGYGLAQWEGPRQADFARWAKHDIRGSSFAEQLRFIQHELTTTESAAGKALKNATDARTAAQIVTTRYERPADSQGEAVRRVERAVGIFNNS